MRVRAVQAGLACAALSGVGRAQIVADGSFEAGTPNPSWAESSTNFGTPLCSQSLCDPSGSTTARTGQWWAWFGGAPGLYEHASLTQSVGIPSGGATLVFYLFAYSARQDGQDWFRASIDGNVVFGITDLQAPSYSSDYTLVAVDLSAYAGGTHVLGLECVQVGTGNLYSNFLVDDVRIDTGGVLCVANCDGSTTQPCLNVLDFGCFLNRFAAGDSRANCDGSTTQPVLNVLDFGCFLNKFAAGCSTC